MKKQLLLLTLSLFFLSLASALTYTQGNLVPITAICNNCSQVNITKITIQALDGGSNIMFVNYLMTKSGTNYNYTFNGTNQVGTYYYITCGDLNGELTCDDNTERSFIISKKETALSLDLTSTLSIVILIIMFIIAGVLIYASHQLFGGVIIMILGFIMLFGEINKIFSFIIIVVGIVAGVSGGKQ